MVDFDWEKPTKIKILRGGDIGLIFIHGFSASTTHMLQLVSYFEKETNYNIIAPLLPGHGTNIEEIHNISWKDWVNEVKNCYEEIKASSEKVIIIGQSMGGCLTLKVAQEVIIDGIVLLSTPYDFTKINKLALYILRPFTKTISKKKGIGDHYRENELFAYTKWSISASFEMVKLLKELKKSLQKITSPALILQGDQDDLVPSNSAVKFYQRISSEEKEIIMIKEGKHLLATGTKKEEIMELISNFVEVNNKV